MKGYFLLLFLINYSWANSQNHTQFWLRTSIQYNFSKKWSSNIEFNHRRQSMENTESPFRFSQTNALRGWIRYKISPSQVINFSPYAYFSNFPTINILSDTARPNSNEHRLQVQYESKLPIGRNFSFINRNGLEYRIFEKNLNLLRIRLREGISYQINKQLMFNLYDELFINTINSSDLFDQNRIGLEADYSVNKQIKLNMGANLINQKPRNSNDININYVLLFHLLYTIK